MSTLYSTLKFLRFQDHIQAYQEGRVLAPVHIRIKPTNRCNHNCWYCAYKVDNLRLGEDMLESDTIPEEKMDEIVQDVCNMGVKAVTFSGGGEPLTYKPLPQVVEKLSQGGVRVAALSNGSNLKGGMADAFAKHGTWIRISIDAWDDLSYQKARGVSGDAFSQVIKNMRDFSNRGSQCVLGVSFIVTPENHKHLMQACTLFKQAGVNHVKLSGVVVANEGNLNNRYHESIQKSVLTSIRQTQTLNDDHFSLINHYHDLEERFDKSYTSCPFLQFLTVIGADGNVYTCQDKAYTQNGLLGSIKDRSFKSFWFSESNQQRIFQLNPSQSCRHHCVSHGKNLAILDFVDINPNHGLFV